jgi:hypothetical protein
VRGARGAESGANREKIGRARAGSIARRGGDL